MDFDKLTESTADTFLEYIQRNLPEGVAMKVTKVCIYFLSNFNILNEYFNLFFFLYTLDGN